LELLKPLTRGKGYPTIEYPFRPEPESEYRQADVGFATKARWQKDADSRVHFTSPATGEQVTADVRLIVVQINSVTAVVESHIRTLGPMNKTIPIAVQQGALPWPADNSLWGGATPLILIRDGISGLYLFPDTNPAITDSEMTNAVRFIAPRAPDDVGGDVPVITTPAPSLPPPLVGPVPPGSGMLAVNQTGSFQVLAFIDSNVNGQRENNEVGVSLPLILVQATVHRNLSYNPVPVVSYTILRDQVANTWSSSLVSAGTLCGNVPGLFIIRLRSSAGG
jgi:hypothetical protein